MKVGTVRLEHMMRVKQLEIGKRTYNLKNMPELPAGEYDVFVNGSDVAFVPTDQAKLGNLLERSEHQ